jgi:hypothetical protein
MKLTVQQIKDKCTEATSIKTSWDSVYRDVFEVSMPARDGYKKTDKDGNYQDNRENLYSSIGEQSSNEFVNTMQEVLAPPMTPWISLKTGFLIKEEDKEKIDAELEKMCEIANEYKSTSSFDMAFSEFLYDLFAGTACLLVLPNRPTKPVSIKAIPIKEYAIEEGIDGEVRGLYRKHSMKRCLIKHQWKDIKMDYTDEEGKKTVELIESSFYDYDLNLFHYQVIDSSENKELYHKEFKTNPFVVVRWNKAAGEAYGRGVGITAMNDIRTYNLIMYYSLRNFAFNTPPLLVSEDAVLNIELFDFSPLSLNVVPDTENSIRPLQIGATNYNVESYKLAQLALDIKKNTYASTLPNEGDKQLTATEIRARIAELRKSLNSVAGRLISEGMIPLTLRILDVLGDVGIFGADWLKQFDINDINGLKYKVNIITPIGKIIRYTEAQTMLAISSTLLQVDPTGGALDLYTEADKMIPDYLDLSGLPNKYISTTQEVQAKKQNMQQQLQQAQDQAIQQDVDASNEKELGKAMAKKEMEV